MSGRRARGPPGAVRDAGGAAGAARVGAPGVARGRARQRPGAAVLELRRCAPRRRWSAVLLPRLSGSAAAGAAA